jgi:thiol-disulfide isomerase/thioredoxin
VADAYKALTSYSDEGHFVVATTLEGKARRETQPLRVTFIRPNKLDLDAGAVRLICDGKTLTTVVGPLNEYAMSPAPERIGIETFRDGPAGALLFGGPTGWPLFVLLNLLLGTSPDVLLEQMGGTLRAAPADLAGADGTGLLIDLREGPDLLLRVDPATKLLTTIEMKFDPGGPAKGAPAGRFPVIERLGWTAGAISTRVAADRSFAFIAPKEFRPTKDLKARAGDTAPGPQYAVEEKLGKPAPDFTLTVLDGPGKTRTLTNRDLAGKVVAIDFWATWGGPCLVELPGIRKVVERYNGTKKDVLIVALSQDDEPREISGVRELVERALAAKKIDLTTGNTGRVGLDPGHAVGRAFRVEGLPTWVILDGKGIIRSVHVGYRADIARELAAEIDALLAGKSLAGEKGQGATEPKKSAREEP